MDDLLDLSSLEKSVVENASAPTAPLEPETPEATAPATPEGASAPEEVVIPEATKEGVAEALVNIENIIDIAEVPEVVLDADGVPINETEVIASENNDNTVYSNLAVFLKEKNILTDTDAVTDEESFVSAIRNAINEGRYEGLTDAQRSYMQAIEAGVPDETAQSLVKDIQSLTGITAATLTDRADISEVLIK